MGFLGMQVYDDPNRQPTNAPFGTYMIVAPTSLFLGILFANFPYDYPLLWSSAELAPGFLDTLTTHLTFLYNSPPIIPRMLHIAISIGYLGFISKLFFSPSESNLLFDGSSLILFTVGVVVYLTNIVKGLQSVASGQFGLGQGDEVVDEVIREDSLRTLAASNTILALVLIGVLVLQSGQWYAEKREGADRKEWAEKEAREGKGGHGHGHGHGHAKSRQGSVSGGRSGRKL